jgi:hypothetical protein
MKTRAKIEFGDFQTPPELAREVCSALTRQIVEADYVIEPTCGVGAFLVAAADAFPKAQLFGWDINGDYIEQTRQVLTDAGAQSRATLGSQDFFSHDWAKELSELRGNLLVLGNLPWVTNATISGMNGGNLPAKENFQGLRGIEALTGKSNFDISEWMLIQLIKALRGRTATIAMLCKTSTARKLLRFAWRNDGRIASASLHRIDAKKHFGASVDACLLLATTGESGLLEARVFPDLSAGRPTTTLGIIGQDLVFDIRRYRAMKHLEGLSPYQWRSGVKHDCASVMELRSDGAMLHNKFDEVVSIEPDYLFPFLKCSDLANLRIVPRRFVVVTQRRVGDDTSGIATTAPRTWRYLDSHRHLFEARKSSIYASGMPFALFGIGDYAFAPWKVAVSGLHSTTRFSVIGPVEGKPVFFDDASYFLSFEAEQEARSVASILNSPPCQNFLSSLIFTDSKRPITVDLLQRLNIHAIAIEAGMADAWNEARNQRTIYRNTASALQPEFMLDQATKPT